MAQGARSSGGVKKVEFVPRARDGQVLAGKTRKARGSPGRSVRGTPGPMFLEETGY